MCAVCPSWLSFILYNPIRKALTDRRKVLEESGITSDSVVLEVGSGNGFLTEALAGVCRRVYAVELQGGMVRKLRKRISRFGETVRVIQGDIVSIELDEGVADVCLLYYCFHEVSSQEEAAARIGRAVRKGGTLAIYEPTVEVRRADMKRTVSLFEKMGFHMEQERSGAFTRFARMRKV
ncbi:MAG: class I SAM-dependent methyltransferase [Nitrospiraceae bacterium]|nr:class I SAM-dependent methyltransferase [Nitrospiraceae bacterium]